MENHHQPMAFNFDETNMNWSMDLVANQIFICSVQNYMNQRLRIKGVVFVNEVLDALGIHSVFEGQCLGWDFVSFDESYIRFELSDSVGSVFVIKLHPDGDVRSVLPNYKAP